MYKIRCSNFVYNDKQNYKIYKIFTKQKFYIYHIYFTDFPLNSQPQTGQEEEKF